MKIRHEATNIVSFEPADHVSLFIYSNKSLNLKKIDLDHLSSEQRGQKLKKWAGSDQFVAVVQRGDEIFAFVSNKLIQQLQSNQDLTIDGKKVSIKGLSQLESERLSEVGQSIEDFIVAPEEVQDQHREEKAGSKRSDAYLARDNLAKKELKKLLGVDRMILRMVIIPDTIKWSQLAKWSQDARKEAHESREHALKKEKEHEKIKSTEIQKEALKHGVEKGEIEKGIQRKLI